ncbi:MAG: 50S ribosomal protein L15 [Anaerolineae bacterium]|nr:50S ribosomal protein L15 [Anaerolineae bacterium]
MKLHDLRPAEGAKKRRMRKGRGIAAGKGKTAGRGTKGQNARAGGGVRPYFEGGQLPLMRRLPEKRGFQNRNRVEYVPVNLERIVGFEQEVTPETLAEAGIIGKASLPVVILGVGELDRALTVRAHRFSASAKAKIEAAGGEVEVLPLNA